MMNERIEFNSSHMHHLARRQMPGSLAPHSHLMALVESLGWDLGDLIHSRDRQGQIALDSAIEAVCRFIRNVYGEEAEALLFAHLEKVAQETIRDLKEETHA